MNNNFIQLVESTINRFTNGGLLVGDLVKIKPKAFNHPDFESNEEVKFKLKEFLNSDLNLRILNIKNNYSSAMAGNNEDKINPRMMLVDIAQEIAPGRYYGQVTVPMDILQRLDNGINLPPIPDSVKYKGKITIKPEIPEEAEETSEFSPGYQTHASVVGKKAVKGDRKLQNSNTVIPSSPAEGQRDPAKFTASYVKHLKK